MSPGQARIIASRSEPEAARAINSLADTVDRLRSERIRLQEIASQLRREKQDMAIAQVERLLALRRQSRIIAHISEIIKS